MELNELRKRSALRACIKNIVFLADVSEVRSDAFSSPLRHFGGKKRSKWIYSGLNES